MAKLDSLKITECPYAFADMARKHNDLVAIIEAMTGAGAASVTVSENNIVINSDEATASALTQAEFNAMLEVAMSGGLISDHLYDFVIDAVLSYFTAEPVAVCGLGTIDILRV